MGVVGTPGVRAEDPGQVVTAAAAVRPDVMAPGTAAELVVTVAIAPEWHVNAHVPSERYLIPTELTLTAPPDVEVGEVRYPSGEHRTFAFNPRKPLATYAGTVTLNASVRAGETAKVDRAALIRGTLRYQACNDTRCLPPRTLDVVARLQLRKQAAGTGDDGDTGAAATSAGGSGATGLGSAWIQGGGVLAYLAAFGIGLLLNLTPCVYPLIAVTVAFFGGQGVESRARVIGLASIYVLGIAIMFSTLGTISAMSGAAFGMALQRPVVLVVIAAMLVALAASNFGLYQLQVPAAVNRWAGRSAKGAGGALFMGLTMGLVAAPCVGPVLAGLLLIVGARQDVLFGSTIFLVLSLGLGAPYVVLAALASAARTLPRSGGWLSWVERLLGFVLVGLALFYIGPLLPPGVRSTMWLALLLTAALYLGFVDRTGNDSVSFVRLKRGVALATVCAALWTAGSAERTTPIRWQPFTPAALAAARSAAIPSVVDFTADWCIPCREMDVTTFHNPAVVGEAQNFAMLRADISVVDEETDALMRAHQVLGVPTYLFFTPDGIEAERLVGFVSWEEFLRAMRQATAG